MERKRERNELKRRENANIGKRMEMERECKWKGKG